MLLLCIEVVPGQTHARLVLEVMPSLIVAVPDVQHLIQRIRSGRKGSDGMSVRKSPCAVFSQLVHVVKSGIKTLSVLVIGGQVERLGPCGQIETVFCPCGVIISLLRRIPVHVPVIGLPGIVVRIIIVYSLIDIIIGLVPGSVQKYSQKVVGVGNLFGKDSAEFGVHLVTHCIPSSADIYRNRGYFLPETDCPSRNPMYRG